MLGRVAWDSRPGRTELGLERLGGMTLARATVHVPPGLGRFRFRARLRRARRFFEQNGVRRLILPESGENSWFSGFGRVDALPFYRAVADLLALGALETAGLRPEQASVALSGPRLCPELRAAAERLYPQVRGLVINVPGEGAAYAAWLHRRYGLPVCPPERADVTVAFGPGGVHRGVALDLYEEGRNLAGMTVTAPELALPGECEEQLLAALWEQGGLKREKLRVRWSAKGVSPLTNGDKVNIIP